MSTQNNEIARLVTRLREIEDRIVELTAGSVDAVMDRQGRPWLLSAAQQELRERSELQRQFSEQQAAILNALPAHIALLDACGDIIDVNEAWRHFGEANVMIDPHHGIGCNYLEVCDAAPVETVEAHKAAIGIRAVLAGERDSFSLEYPCPGSEVKRWFNLVAAPLRSFRQGGVVIMHIDITQLKAHEAELDRVAHYDVLTGLPNRRLLADRLEHAVRHARRHEEPLAVCYLDLDNFKPINDRWGHSTGDRVLFDVARRMETCLRESDTISRIGGDEFVLLLPGISGESELDQVLGRLMEVLHEPFVVDGTVARVSSSMGVALFPDDGKDADTLLRYADQAMYSAKAAGRDRYFRFNSKEIQQSEERQSRLQSIIEGLEKQEFVLFYQPKVDLRDGSLIGLEALVRWQHPEHGLLSPAEFLGFVIDSDCEIQFGEYVLDTALAQLALWQAQGLRLCVSINVSGNELTQPGLADRIAASLARQEGIHPTQLEIEVLETTAIRDINQVLVALSECRSAGVQVSLDDFGTGYSSLTVFRHLPVNTLKIDQSFVRDMLKDNDDRSIVESVIHMARAFNRHVVAEGVETMEHARALLAMGCFQVQGHGIARPMEADAVPGWISGWQQRREWEALGGVQ